LITGLLFEITVDNQNIMNSRINNLYGIYEKTSERSLKRKNTNLQILFKF